MKSILLFFSIIFVALGAGIYFYETQIASPNAADVLIKSKKKAPAKVMTNPAAVIKKPSLAALTIDDTMTNPVKPSRVFDLVDYDQLDQKQRAEQINKQRDIEKSIKSAIKKSTRLDIQKAVVTQMSKKR